MSDLSDLLFGGGFRPPPLVPDSYVGRSRMYGKAKGMVLGEARKLEQFTVEDICSATGMNRFTAARTLRELANKGTVKRVKTQTAGCNRTPAVWKLTSPL